MDRLKDNILKLVMAASLGLAGPIARADSVVDWNTRASDWIVEAKMGTPPAVRLMAIAQTAVHAAALDAAQRQPAAERGVAVDAAVAAASRVVLQRMLPAQEAAIARTYTTVVAALPQGDARAAGIAAGEKAAQAVLSARSDDGAAGPGEPYRPHAAAGAYVPTSAAAAPHWGKRKPWLMARADQFRPAAPPELGSAQWARDYNEVKAFGSKGSTVRTPQQTEAARFWEYSLPSIYFGVVRSVAQASGRDTVRNAALYAASAQAMDDGLIAVFDAKYHYNFWRPVTAIRNGDRDGNDATERDAGWTPLIEAPLHPEYPSAHSILAGAVGTVLLVEIGDGPAPALGTTSGTPPGSTRRWQSVDEFVQEVASARVWEGIHFRFSTDTGLAMGRRVGALAAERLRKSNPG